MESNSITKVPVLTGVLLYKSPYQSYCAIPFESEAAIQNQSIVIKSMHHRRTGFLK